MGKQLWPIYLVKLATVVAIIFILLFFVHSLINRHWWAAFFASLSAIIFFVNGKALSSVMLNYLRDDKCSQPTSEDERRH